MILNFFFQVVAWLINAVATILPTFSLYPSGLAANITTVVTYLNGWNWIFPVGTVMAVLALFILVVFAEFTYFTAMYVFSIIHATIRG